MMMEQKNKIKLSTMAYTIDINGFKINVGPISEIGPISEKKKVVQIYKSQASQILNPIHISTEDTINYFQIKIDVARKLEHKIRLNHLLIQVMTCNIIKKHCI